MLDLENGTMINLCKCVELQDEIIRFRHHELLLGYFRRLEMDNLNAVVILSINYILPFGNLWLPKNVVRKKIRVGGCNYPLRRARGSVIKYLRK